MKCCQPTGKVREFDLVWRVVTLDPSLDFKLTMLFNVK